MFETISKDYLLYNSLSNSFMELDEETYSFFIRSQLNTGLLLGSEYKDILIDQKVLVDDDDAEIAEITYLEKLVQTSNKVLHLTIAPTYDCNFDCIYCYEDNRRHLYMDDDTIEALVSFIKDYKDMHLNIAWYGGEPLLALQQIKKICDKLNYLSIISNQSIITNGYLLNHKAIDIFQKYNIRSAQITIDGPEDVHDSRRFLKGEKPTFYRIIENVENLLGCIPDFSIDFRVNVDKQNESYYKEIYDFLNDKFENRNINVYAGFVEEVSVCKKRSHCIFDRQQIVNFKKQLFAEYDLDLGIYPDVGRNNCVANLLNGYVIGADGLIFKCWNDVGINEKSISSVFEKKITNRTLFYRYLNAGDNRFDTICSKCFLLPICNGGCKFQQIENLFSNNKIDTCHFAKDNLKGLLELYYNKKYKP